MKSTKKKLGPKDIIFLSLLSFAVYLVTAYLVPYLFFTGDESSTFSLADLQAKPIVFDESVTEETNPYIADVRALTQTVAQRYAYVDYRKELDGLDLKGLESAALSELGDGTNEDAFQRAVRRFVVGLHDGHSFVLFANHKLPANRHFPFTALLVAEGVMIDGVHPDAEGVLQRGDIILAVDGDEIEKEIARTTRDIYASTDHARHRKALAWLTNWTKKPEILLRFKRPGESVREIKIECPLRRLKIPKPGILSTKREGLMLADDIAFFRPQDFLEPKDSGFKEATREERKTILSATLAQLDRTFASFDGARALILDLRGNPGGTDMLGKALVAHLIKPGFTYLLLSSQRRAGWSKPSAAFTDETSAQVFQGKLVCLIDSGTFSTADNVAVCLRDQHPDVVFVGENTGAGTGAPRTFTLPRTNTRVTFCTMRVYSHNGSMIEGTGVAPDVEILRTRADVIAGRDTVLNAALKLLKR